MVGWPSALENMELNGWKNRNVFVTGAAGLLGSWLTEALIERGANPDATCDSYGGGTKLSAGTERAVFG